MLDKLPPYIRHLILLLLAWLVANGANFILRFHFSPMIAGLVGIGFTIFVAVVTPITKQYGAGSKAGEVVNVGKANIPVQASSENNLGTP